MKKTFWGITVTILGLVLFVGGCAVFGVLVASAAKSTSSLDPWTGMVTTTIPSMSDVFTTLQLCGGFNWLIIAGIGVVACGIGRIIDHTCTTAIQTKQLRDELNAKNRDL